MHVCIYVVFYNTYNTSRIIPRMENSLANHFVLVKVWTFVDDSVSLRIHCNVYEMCACERGNVIHLIHVTRNPTHDGEANRVKHYQAGKIRKDSERIQPASPHFPDSKS